MNAILLHNLQKKEFGMQINNIKINVGKIFKSLPEGILLSYYFFFKHASLNIIEVQNSAVHTDLPPVGCIIGTGL